MLFNPDIMPDYGRSKGKIKKISLRSTGKIDKVSYRQNEKSKHRQPSTYTAAKVEKRKS